MTAGQEKAAVHVSLGAKLLLGCVAVVVAFGVCEAGARLVYTAPPEPAREPQLLFQRDPALGFIHMPNQVGWLDDGLASVNAMGLRGRLPQTPAPAGLLRVLAIGDSTTFGWGVNDDETYTAQLEQRIAAMDAGRPVEVINAGVSAYDLRQSLKRLKLLAPALHPNLVLVGLFWNDLPYETITPEGVSLRATPVAAGLSSGSSSKPWRLGNQPSRLNRILRSSRVMYVLRHAWLAAIAPTEAATNQVRWEMALLEGRESEAIDDAWKDIERTLTEIRATSQAAGSDVAVVIMPIRSQVEGRYPGAAYQTRAKRIAESLGLQVIDPLPLFQAQSNPARLFIPYDRMHFSTLGNTQLAAATFEALRDRLGPAAPPQH